MFTHTSDEVILSGAALAHPIVMCKAHFALLGTHSTPDSCEGMRCRCHFAGGITGQAVEKCLLSPCGCHDGLIKLANCMVSQVDFIRWWLPMVIQHCREPWSTLPSHGKYWHNMTIIISQPSRPVFISYPVTTPSRNAAGSHAADWVVHKGIAHESAAAGKWPLLCT